MSSLSEFDFPFDEKCIALSPVTPRDHCKLLCVKRHQETLSHEHFHQLDSHLNPGDCLVLNNTKVLAARLFGSSKSRTFEILLLRPLDRSQLRWSCLAKPGNKLDDGQFLTFEGGVEGRIEGRTEGTFVIEFAKTLESRILEWLERHGKMPLPPYLGRDSTEQDKLDYQTLYAAIPGSVAAPTAGLHFTPDLLQRIRSKGVSIVEMTLHVGYGTFAPIRVENIHQHTLHEETYTISDATFQTILETRRRRGRIIAVGTTCVRALESIPQSGLRGDTRIFIKPGYKFQWVDGLITNFHLPKSSLFVLACAYLGSTERLREIYGMAAAKGYRFFSYGDAMLIL